MIASHGRSASSVARSLSFCGAFPERVLCTLWQGVVLNLCAAAELGAVAHLLRPSSGHPGISCPAGTASEE
jgi:hypothetical protein